jgi:glucose-1-phosphate adenylyltransferase
VIEGTVQNSILSPGVKISQNTVVSDSIIFHDTMIHPGSVIEKCIIDKLVTIEKNVRIGEGPSIPNKKFPHHLFTGITVIGKGATIGSHITIGKNCIIEPAALLDKIARKSICSGTTL